MMDFSEVMHHHDFPFIIWEFGQHFFLHEFDSNDLVSGQLIPFVNRAKISLAQLFRFIDVELGSDLLHTTAHETCGFHSFKYLNIIKQSAAYLGPTHFARQSLRNHQGLFSPISHFLGEGFFHKYFRVWRRTRTKIVRNFISFLAQSGPPLPPPHRQERGQI